MGEDVDSARFPTFPALYVAEDFETAYREYHLLPKDATREGLTPDELSLEHTGSWATLKLSGHVNNVFDLTRVANLNGVSRILARFNLSSRVRELEEAAGKPPTVLVRKPAALMTTFMDDNWRALPVHCDVPANSQVFARLVMEAGFEGILYRSAKGAKKCLAIFTRQLSNSDSCIALHTDLPADVQFAQLDATNCNEI